MTLLGGDRFLVIERDNEQGEAARFKKVYLVDLSNADAEGYLVKEEVLDLLQIHDPDRISEPGREDDIGLADPYSFPFQTIESILPLDGRRLLLLNDNNYPLSAGRNPEQPDDTVAIIIRPTALRDDPAVLSSAARPPPAGSRPRRQPVLRSFWRRLSPFWQPGRARAGEGARSKDPNGMLK